MKAHKITIPKTAHYYTIGTPSKNIKRLIFVCHGYGQLASNIIHKFDGFDDGETLIVAPEALSHFYWKGFFGDVGASWMTKHHRLDEIADYCRYLTTLYTDIVAQLSDNVKITLFGFSQGVATQCRWVINEQIHFHNLILWAGTFPDDIDYKPYLPYLSSKKIKLVYGLQDQFLTADRVEKLKIMIDNQGIQYDVITFEGKHVVDRTVLKEVLG